MMKKNKKAIIYTLYTYFFFSLIFAFAGLVFFKTINLNKINNNNIFAEKTLSIKKDILDLLEESLNSLTRIETNSIKTNVTIEASLNPNINISENLIQTESFINKCKNFYGININTDFSQLKTQLNNVTRIIYPQQVFVIHDYDNKKIYLNNTQEFDATYIFLEHNETTFRISWFPLTTGTYPVIIKTHDLESVRNLDLNTDYTAEIKIKEAIGATQSILIDFLFSKNEIIIDYSDLSTINNITLYLKNELNASTKTRVKFGASEIVNISFNHYETSI